MSGARCSRLRIWVTRLREMCPRRASSLQSRPSRAILSPSWIASAMRRVMRASVGPSGCEGSVLFLGWRRDGVAANCYEISLGGCVMALLLGGSEPNRDPASRRVVRDLFDQSTHGFEQIG